MRFEIKLSGTICRFFNLETHLSLLKETQLEVNYGLLSGQTVKQFSHLKSQLKKRAFFQIVFIFSDIRCLFLKVTSSDLGNTKPLLCPFLSPKKRRLVLQKQKETFGRRRWWSTNEQSKEIIKKSLVQLPLHPKSFQEKLPFKNISLVKVPRKII